MKKITILALFALLMSSCATIFTGSKQKITFDSNIKKAKSITIDGRKHKDVSFPYVTKVKRGYTESVVTGEAEGYEDAKIIIYKAFNAVSLVNLLGPTIVGFGIDAATGALMKPEYKQYELEFSPVEK